VPDDIAVAGYSNDPAGNLISPSLTTIDQSGYNIGQSAVTQLLDMIHHHTAQKKADRKIVIPVQLIVRESSVRQKNQ
jgi:LacI family transcriptional regulator